MRKSIIHNSSLLLLQGSMLIVLSLYVFFRPVKDYQQLLNVTGLFSLWYGIVNIFKFFFGEDRGRILPELLTGTVLIIMGIVLFRTQTVEQSWQMPVIAFSFLVMSLQVFLYAMELSFSMKWWILSFTIVVVSILVAFNLLIGKRIFEFPRYIIPGIQMLVLGVLMIWLSLRDRNLEMEFRKTLRELKEGRRNPE
jgi:uncharacterized membrane protein HdeD (DUF308 family)